MTTLTQTPTHKTKPSAWRPRRLQWFNAYLKRYNKLHRCGPFKCTGMYNGRQIVQAMDAEGDSFEFKLRDFRLVAADTKGGE